MKTLFYTCIIISLCLSGCKKDKGDDEFHEEPYSFGPPECLMSNVKLKAGADTSDWTYEYDTQKRLVLITKAGSPGKTSYIYSEGKMIVEELVDWGNGDTSTVVTTNYLNAKGFISKAVEEDGTETFYTYNEDGYLIRIIEKEEVGGYRSGSSYEYTDGNRTAVYKLNVDAQTGETISRTLAVSYTYYDKMPGKMEVVWAWIDRQGRGSKNEVKSMNRGGNVMTYEYLIASNSLPKSMNQIYGGTIILRTDLVWKCN